MSEPIVLAITGASGAVYGLRLLEVLASQGQDVDVLVSTAGAEVLRQEADVMVDPGTVAMAPLLGPHRFREHSVEPKATARLRRFGLHDWSSPVAGGSAQTGGMVVCPCSGGTLSGIATGASNNLIQRAADVHLKERRRLILVPRETPLSSIHLVNMQRVTDAGAVVLPAMPGWYHSVESVNDLIDFVVARILDQLQVPHQLGRRWGDEEETR